MKKNIFYFAILIIACFILFKVTIKGIEKDNLKYCNDLKKQEKEYPNFYATENQKE
ncbi:MAG: hypothetical protein WC549_04570 [Actinomycetota bacterium]